ncbi:MAG: ATP-NAD kinase family protein [Desulfurococcaceae archaeon]
MKYRKVGFIINPVAGMGGSVGLKGTDGDAYFKAIERGARPVAPRRAREFLESVESKNFHIIAAAGSMGEDVVRSSKHKDKLIHVIGTRKELTTRQDTIEIAQKMMNQVDILVFVGGDGTARDIYEAIDSRIPVIGVPSGVKMYSGVFAITPLAAAKLFDQYIQEETILEEKEVLDIDENAYRQDQLIVKLYGYLLIPVDRSLVQSTKTIYIGLDEEIAKESIAEYIAETMDPSTPYILGPGSTVKAICKKLGLDCTLLGVDVLYRDKIIIKDAWEKDILEVLKQHGRVKIILSPIGGQGFLLGRGNQQISSNVLSKVSKEDIIIVSTEQKIRDIKCLMIDLDDPVLVSKFSGYYKVLVNYKKFVVVKTC